MENVRKSFQQTLEEIRQEMVQMAALVTEGIPRATEALLAGDLTEAQQIIEGDDPRDALAVELEEVCYQQLALQQPMAGDLRGIVTAIRMISEIERSGDRWSTRQGLRRIFAPSRPGCGLINQMGRRPLGYSARHRRLHRRGRPWRLRRHLDDRLDAIHRDYIQEIFLVHNSGSLPVQAAVQLALIGRYYERIGDHAVNIGERVRYMVTGWLPEHTGAARAAAAQTKPPPEEG